MSVNCSMKEPVPRNLNMHRQGSNKPAGCQTAPARLYNLFCRRYCFFPPRLNARHLTQLSGQAPTTLLIKFEHFTNVFITANHSYLSISALMFFVLCPNSLTCSCLNSFIKVISDRSITCASCSIR